MLTMNMNNGANQPAMVDHMKPLGSQDKMKEQNYSNASISTMASQVDAQVSEKSTISTSGLSAEQAQKATLIEALSITVDVEIARRTELVNRLSMGKDYRDQKVAMLVAKKERPVTPTDIEQRDYDSMDLADLPNKQKPVVSDPTQEYVDVQKRAELVNRLSFGKDYRDRKVAELTMKRGLGQGVTMTNDYDCEGLGEERDTLVAKREKLVASLSMGKDYRDRKVMELEMKKYNSPVDEKMAALEYDSGDHMVAVAA